MGHQDDLCEDRKAVEHNGHIRGMSSGDGELFFPEIGVP